MHPSVWCSRSTDLRVEILLRSPPSLTVRTSASLLCISAFLCTSAAMALSRLGKVAVIPLAAILMLLCAGAAQAWNCASNEKDCNGCINPLTDVNNCGKCGNKCPACGNGVAKCNNGKCDYECMPGYANCDNDWSNGCECFPDTDVEHCGGCGKKCPELRYYGGEKKCTKGKCETKSCKQGMKYDEGKKCCKNDDGGKKGGEHGGYDGGKKGGEHGGYDGGKKGGDRGGDNGRMKGGYH